MIFLTVGTEYPFDRLVRAVDEAIPHLPVEEAVFGQIGPSRIRPHNMEYMVKLDKLEYERKMLESRAVISHAGMGTIMLALKLRKPLLVMPRLRKFGEIVNNHQITTARHFGQLGYFIVAQSPQEVLFKISALESFRPKVRLANHDRMVQHIITFLDLLSR